ncbi:MAG: PrsW family intramembrane metalloprotease [Clostridia bacterium]|nr:PrsW family intramembrane metalloprotease [Clostridia bacterium]
MFSEAATFFFNPVLIAAAVLPAAALLIYVYKKDRLEPEPKSLLLRLLVMGVLATSAAAFVERIGLNLLAQVFDEYSLPCIIIFNMLIVAPAEELAKYLLLRWRTWNSPHFNCSFDGVVYAVFVSLGFALWENIDYVTSYGLSVAAIRAVTAVPGHCAFAIFMGAWYGQAKRREAAGDAAGCRRCLRTGVRTAILLHGLYDVFASLATPEGAWIFFAFILVMFVIAFRLLRAKARADDYLGM